MKILLMRKLSAAKRRLYPRFTLWSVKNLPAGVALSIWWRDLKIGWKFDGWRTLICP